MSDSPNGAPAAARPEHRRPTQQDVARLAGVSRATVSYVLNDHEGRVPLTDDTRQRVWAAIKELGYEPDPGARALRSGHSGALGLLLPDFNNPHYWQAANGVEEEARSRGYDLVISTSGLDREREERSIAGLDRRRVDGFVILPSHFRLSPETVELLRGRSRPVVEFKETDSGFDCVVGTYGQGMRELLDGLAARGHRRVAFIYGVASENVGQGRREAFLGARGAAGRSAEEWPLVRCGPQLADGYARALEVLRGPARPTAVVAINDLLAFGAMRAAADLGLRVPHDLSVAGFDDNPLAAFTTPRLTSVSRDTIKQGRIAVRLICQRLANPDAPRQTVRLDSEVHWRESTGPAPAPPSGA